MKEPIKKYKGLDDILLSGVFDSVDDDILEKAYKLKCIQMRVGKLWEEIFCLYDFGKLPDGADLISHKYKIIMELKNSTRTDNSTSLKGNVIRLIETRQKLGRRYSRYNLVYGYVNGEACSYKKEFYGETVYFLVGDDLLHFVMGDDYKKVIKYMKKEISYILHS